MNRAFETTLIRIRSLSGKSSDRTLPVARSICRSRKMFSFRMWLILACVLGLPGLAGAATRTWSGATSTDWNTATNWTGGVAPVAADTANIPGGLTNYPNINNTVAIAVISINSASTGATLTVSSGGILTATGLITVNATGSFIQTGGTATLTGLTSTNVVNVSGGTLTSTVNLILNSGAVLTQSGGTIHLATNTSTSPTDSIVIASGATVNQSAGTLYTKDYPASAGTFNQTGSTALFKIFHDWKPGTGSTFNSTAGTVQFTGSGGGGPDFSSGTRQFSNMIVDDGVDPVFDNIAVANIPISGSFTNNNNNLNVSNGATFTFNGTGDQSIYSISDSGNATFGHLVINKASGTVSTISNIEVAGNATITNGTLDIGANIFKRTASGGTLTVSNSATFKLGGTNGIPTSFTTKTLSSSSTVEFYGTNQAVGPTDFGNLILSGSGTKTFAAGTTGIASNLTVSGTATANTTTNSSTVMLNGSGVNQSIAGITFYRLTMNNSSGATITGDATVNNVLTLTTGNITTGANTLSIGSAGSVSRTSGHAVGNFKKYIATGATSKTFEVGDASTYTPVLVSFASVTTAGNLTASVASGDHSNIGTSIIIPAESVNRNWTLTNSGIVFTNYDATFTFVAGDVDSGASTSAFIVGRYSGGSWTYPTVGTKTSTTTQATGLTTFGDFQLGEVNRVTKTWDGGAGTNNWGDAANWNTDGVPASTDNVDLTGANTINIDVAAEANNLTLNNAGLTLTLNSGSSLAVSEALTLTAGTLNMGTNTISGAGSFTLSSGGNLGIGSTAGITSSGATGNVQVTGTRTFSTGANYTYNGTLAQVTGNGLPATVNNLTMNNSVGVTSSASVIVGSNLTVTAGMLDLGGFTANRTSAGGTLTVSDGATLMIGGTNTLPSNYSTHSIGATSTIDYDGTTQSVAVLNSAQDYGNLTISGSGTKTLAGSENIAGNLLVSGGVFALGAFTADRLSAGGTLTVANGATLRIGGTNTFPSNYSTHSIGTTSTVEYSGTTQSVVGLNSAQNYGNLTISGSGTKTLAGSQSLAGNLSVSGGLFDLGSFTADRLSAGGTLTVASGATLKIGGTNTLPANYSTHSIGGTSTVEYSGTTQSVAVLNSANYGHLTISGSGTKTLAGSESVAGNLLVSAGLFDLASFTLNRASLGGTLTVSNGATLKIGGTNGFPANYSTRALGTTSTVEYGGTAQTVGAQNYGHLTLSNSGTKTFASGTIGIAGTFTITDSATANMTANSPTVDYNGSGPQNILAQTYHNLTISNAGTKTLAGDTIVNNNLAVSNTTTLDLGSFTANRASAGGTLSVANGATVKIGGTNTLPSNYSTHSIGATSTIDYSGTDQSLVVLNSAQDYGNLTISGSGTKTLAGNVNVSSTLLFTNGTITTGAYTLYIKSSGTVTRVSGHVIGNFKKSVATGATSKTFEVGDAGNYTPVLVSFASVTTAGDLTASVVSGDHPSIGTSTVNASQSVNRNWTLANGGIVFTTYDATFNFVAPDVDGGANTNAFNLARYSGGSWTYPGVGTKTTTSTQATALSGFGDFQIGTTTYGISGHIQNASGLAISGVTVNLSGGQTSSTTTDVGGNYSFAGLPATNNYTVTPTKTDYTFSSASLTYNNLTANQTTSDFAGSSTVTYSISGHIQNASSLPISGVTVTLSGAQTGTITTDASGNFSFPALPSTNNYTVTPSLINYTFSASSRTYNALEANHTTPVFTGTSTVTYSISGHIQNASSIAIGGVTVTLSGGQSGSTSTDVNGDYSFVSLPSTNNYTVTPSLTDYAFSAASQTYTALAANQTNADFSGASTLTHTISGHIQNASSVAISGVTVTLSGGQTGTTTTNASGNYSFANLPSTNDYTVTPTRTNYTFSEASLTFNNLIANQTTADFTGALVPYYISGHIADGSSTAVSGVTVTLSGGQAGTTTTDASGYYFFAGLLSDESYTITPSKTNYAFNPVNLTYNNMTANVLNADFIGTDFSGHAPALGAATSFAVLAATTVTNTGLTVVSGNVGVSPGTAVTGFGPGVVQNGAIYGGSGSLAGPAAASALTAYNDLQGQGCLPANNLSGKILGVTTGAVTLGPGVYCFDTSAQLTTTLTLDDGGDPNALFIFQIGTTLTTASYAQVVMSSGGRGANVYWAIGTSATLGTFTTLRGNVIADTSITVTTEVSTTGRLIAISGAVTMDTNNVAAVLTPAPPNITLIASVSPTGIVQPRTDLVYTITFSNGGTGSASAFVITDPIPANTDFKLGSMTTSLGTTGLTPTLAYSDNGGLTWAYTPVSAAGGAPAGYDRDVTHVRWIFGSSLSPTSPNNAGSVTLTARIR